MNAADVLEKAADLLERRGWCRDFYNHPDGRRHCAIGAIDVVTFNRAYREQESARYALSCFVKHCVETWNDDHVKDGAEVTSTMRACAALLRAKETPAPPPPPFDMVGFAKAAMVGADRFGRLMHGKAA